MKDIEVKCEIVQRAGSFSKCTFTLTHAKSGVLGKGNIDPKWSELLKRDLTRAKRLSRVDFCRVTEAMAKNDWWFKAGYYFLKFDEAEFKEAFGKYS